VGVGHCPFHDDEHASFSVNKEGNYWNYFAGCGGGNIMQFKRKWEAINKNT
jgi:DNA primase